MLGRIVKYNVDDAQFEEREDKGRYPQVEDTPPQLVAQPDDLSDIDIWMSMSIIYISKSK